MAACLATHDYVDTLFRRLSASQLMEMFTFDLGRRLPRHSGICAYTSSAFVLCLAVHEYVYPFPRPVLLYLSVTKMLYLTSAVTIASPPRVRLHITPAVGFAAHGYVDTLPRPLSISQLKEMFTYILGSRHMPRHS